MGNQESNHKNNSQIDVKHLLKKNKHFEKCFVQNLGQEQLRQLLSQLGLKGLSHQQGDQKLKQSFSLNSLQFNDHYSFQKSSQRLQNRMGKNYSHIINVRGIKVQEYKNLCSLTRKVLIHQEGYQFSLKDVMNEKSHKKMPFSQSQILLILSKIVKAVISMHDNELKNIPLDTQAILFVKEPSENEQISHELQLNEYTCKVIDQDIVQKNEYRQFLQRLGEQHFKPKEQVKKLTNLSLYLSPQLLDQAKLRNFYPANVTSKSDIFTLGMIMMEICCQEEMYFCYDVENLTFDYESLIHRIAKITYSNELKLLLAEMLQYDVNNRIGFVSLSEKLERMMLAPFEQTRKLKRRSSSTTMLKELLSCSRATDSNCGSKQPQQQEKNVFKIIESVNYSETKRKELLQTHQHSTGQQALKKSSSLVSLKCKPNSFLTSKKSNLNRANSNSKLQTEQKSFLHKTKQVQNKKMDYHSIIKNRMKTEPKIMDCPQGDTTRQEEPTTTSKFSNLQNKQKQNQHSKINQQMEVSEKQTNPDELSLIKNKQPPTKTQLQQNGHYQAQQSKIQTEQQQSLKKRKTSYHKFSYVQKKVINLDKIILTSSVSSQKLKKSKSVFESSVQKSISNDQNINNSNKEYKKNLSLNKMKKQSSFSVKKTLNLTQNTSQKMKQKDSNISNKNWIMDKLKNKNNLTKNSQNTCNIYGLKRKSSGNKKQSSLSKKKLSSTSPYQIETHILKNQPQNPVQNFSSIQKYKQVNQPLSHVQLQNKGTAQNFNKNDTIIKRLELTEQKNELQIFNSRHQDNIKDQLHMIDTFLQKCNLSSSRWNQENSNQKKSQMDNFNVNSIGKNSLGKEMKSSFVHENYVKYPEFKEKINASKRIDNAPSQNNQFKKKSKIIDIDLGDFSKQNVQKQPLQKQQTFSASLIKQPFSKLQKLKQLTIFTEEQNSSENMSSKQTKLESLNTQSSKENSMKNSNLPTNIQKCDAMRQKPVDIKSVKLEKTKARQNHHEDLNIPYQRIEYANLFMNQQSVITPNNMNDLNKFYGKGMTLESVESSTYAHRKDYSTLSKPFQQIELNYFETQPNINQIFIPAQPEQQKEKQLENSNKRTIAKDNSPEQKKSSNYGSSRKQNILLSINAEQLTFRLKPKSTEFFDINREEKTKQNVSKPSQIQKVNYFQKQDGSFIMREQNPLKSIQTSSIIDPNKTNNAPRDTVQQLFKESTKDKYLSQNHYKGYEQSFYQDDSRQMVNSQQMDSSCNSINLSQIQNIDHRPSFLFAECQTEQRSSQRRRKHKQISILDPYMQQQQHNSKDLSINMKHLQLRIQEQVQNQNISTVRSQIKEEYDTYRRYLASKQFTARIVELQGGSLYEGEVNQHGEFQGNGMISRNNQDNAQKMLVYTGSFANGLYHGFGTLYQIQDYEEKVLKLPNYHKRMSFGAQKTKLKSHKADKYFSLSLFPIKYQGEFSQGKQNGFGTYTYENGDKFSGCIKNGVIQGYGTYNLVQQNETISGMWKNNAYSDC